MSGIYDEFGGSLTADVLNFNPDTIPEPDTLHIRMTRGERHIADELDEQAGSITKDGYTWQEDVIHDFADRIRKLAKEDENGN